MRWSWPISSCARVLRDLAELVVDVGDDPAVVGGRDDRRLVERVAQLVEAAERFGHRTGCAARRAIVVSHHWFKPVAWGVGVIRGTHRLVVGRGMRYGTVVRPNFSIR